MLHQELDAMLFQRDRKRIILRHALKNLHIVDVELVAAGCPFIGTHSAGNNNRRFLSEVLDAFKHFGCNRSFGDDALNESAAVTEDREEQLAALAQVVQPPAYGDALPFACSDLGDGGYGRVGGGDWFFFDL